MLPPAEARRLQGWLLSANGAEGGRPAVVGVPLFPVAPQSSGWPSLREELPDEGCQFSGWSREPRNAWVQSLGMFTSPDSDLGPRVVSRVRHGRLE